MEHSSIFDLIFGLSVRLLQNQEANAIPLKYETGMSTGMSNNLQDKRNQRDHRQKAQMLDIRKRSHPQSTGLGG